MRHGKLNKRFGRNRSQRIQLMRSLTRALFISYRIETTITKAKETRRMAERLITTAKDATLSDIRRINDLLQDRTLTKKLVSEIAPLFKERSSGYTRIMRTGFRKGDGAPLAILELVEMPKPAEKRPKKEKKQRIAQEEKLKKEEKPAPEVIHPEKEKKKKEPATKEPHPPKAEERPKEPPKKEERPKEEELKGKEEKPEEKGFLGRFKKFFKK
jgi:large subunit ribosomal protein L17